MLQVVNHDIYSNKADRSFSSIANIFSRGTIFFQNKDSSLVSAATLKSGFIVAINPQILKEPEVAYQKLNEILPTDHDSFIVKASKKDDTYEEIAKRLSKKGHQIFICPSFWRVIFQDFKAGGGLFKRVREY